MEWKIYELGETLDVLNELKCGLNISLNLKLDAFPHISMPDLSL
jgi:hypothetical protein